MILLAAAAILAGVVAVATGRGGELARSQPDRPHRSDFRTWADVASYRPPPALLGYQAEATEHALALIARTIAERDAEIDWLRQRLEQAHLTQDAGHGGEMAGLVPVADPAPDPGGCTPAAARTEGQDD